MLIPTIDFWPLGKLLCVRWARCYEGSGGLQRVEFEPCNSFERHKSGEKPGVACDTGEQRTNEEGEDELEGTDTKRRGAASLNGNE